jgi:hypothetical protein
MSVAALKKLFNENGVVSIIALIVGLYALSIMYNYFSSKNGYYASEGADAMKDEYKNSDGSGPAPNGAQIQAPAGIQPADEKPNEYSLVNESQVMSAAVSQGSSAELLPKDNNSQWSQLNPAGAGELQGINLLNAGYHIGIDTIGQTLRNANLQLRSEPPNPQISVGPWNQTTISPDLMRIPLELGAGGQ